MRPRAFARSHVLGLGGTASTGAKNVAMAALPRMLSGPLAHLSVESLDAARIGRPRIVSNHGDLVSFQGFKTARRMTTARRVLVGWQLRPAVSRRLAH